MRGSKFYLTPARGYPFPAYSEKSISYPSIAQWDSTNVEEICAKFLELHFALVRSRIPIPESAVAQLVSCLTRDRKVDCSSRAVREPFRDVPLMAGRLKGVLGCPDMCQDRLGMLKNPSYPWRGCPVAGENDCDFVPYTK